MYTYCVRQGQLPPGEALDLSFTNSYNGLFLFRLWVCRCIRKIHASQEAH